MKQSKQFSSTEGYVITEEDSGLNVCVELIYYFGMKKYAWYGQDGSRSREFFSKEDAQSFFRNSRTLKDLFDERYVPYEKREARREIQIRITELMAGSPSFEDMELVIDKLQELIV